MLYRLLRNNKESGPFTALQLREMGLKPYDLLWTEGRGAAWQYASEITELKDFAPVIEEKPLERVYKQEEDGQANAQPAVAVKKVKPRYRISNGQLIMIEAGNMEVGTNGVIKETLPAIKETAPIHHINTLPVENKMAETPDWQNTYPQWQPQPKKEAKTEEPVEVETKYSESLDNLKKRYAEKVLGDKKEPLSSSLSSASIKQNIMAVVALVVLVAGGYIGYTLKKKGDASIMNGQPAVERADIAGNNSASAQQQLSPDNSSTSNENVIAGNKGDKTPNNTQAKNEGRNTNQVMAAANNGTLAPSVVKENNKTATVVPQKKSAEVAAQTNTTGADKTANKPVVPDNKATNGNTAQQTAAITVKNSNTTSSLPTVAPSIPVAKPATKQIGDYVAVKKLGGSGAGVQNVKLMVSNVTDFPIDLAVVDIQYFDSKGKFQKGETMYVKDINGGNNVEVRVPDSDKSSSIKYKVSMVQADQKTLYMVAD